MIPSRMCYWAVLYMLPVTHIYRPPTECRRLCFHICLSFCPRGVGGFHMTITHDALHLTVQSHPSHTQPLPQPPWTPLLPCTWNLDVWWPPLKHVRLASGQPASYWNAFVFALCQRPRLPSSSVLSCCNLFVTLYLYSLVQNVRSFIADKCTSHVSLKSLVQKATVFREARSCVILSRHAASFLRNNYQKLSILLF